MAVDQSRRSKAPTVQGHQVFAGLCSPVIDPLPAHVPYILVRLAPQQLARLGIHSLQRESKLRSLLFLLPADEEDLLARQVAAIFSDQCVLAVIHLLPKQDVAGAV